MVQAIIKELQIQKEYLGGETVETIYLGGGTPSLLEISELNSIFDTIFKHFPTVNRPEITLEANPDDLTHKYVTELSKTVVNRLSIGVQSFFDEDLQFMNRVHNAAEAQQSIINAQDVGISNISIDLIYGTPTLTNKMWETNLLNAFSLGVPHLSCYCLTVEPNTALAYKVANKQAPPVDEQKASEQFMLLMKTAASEGWWHYEISNLCKPGMLSRHNSNYWKNKKYLGIGPSAHSFNGSTRQWNVRNNRAYIKAIEENIVPAEVEMLNINERFNEYVLTSLRTMWGCNIVKVEGTFGMSFASHLIKQATPFVQKGEIIFEENSIILTPKGKILADSITTELFV